MDQSEFEKLFAPPEFEITKQRLAEKEFVVPLGIDAHFTAQQQFKLGVAFLEGSASHVGIPQDDRLARKAFEVAMSISGETYPDAECALAYLIWNGRAGFKHDRSGAAEIWKRNAALGHPKSQVNLAQLYKSGFFGKADAAVALQFLKAAAASLDPDATYFLARAYEEGSMIKSSKKKAWLWYRRAVRNGSSKALLRIGQHLHQAQSQFKQKKWPGTSPERIRKSAVKWLRRAADAGEIKALNLLVSLCDEPFESEFNYQTKDVPAHKISQYISAAKLGSSEASFRLGEIYEREAKSTRDFTKTLDAYLLAAKRGHLRAQLELGRLLNRTPELERYQELGARLILDAAEKGDQGGARSAQSLYLEGNGVTKDREKARQWGSLANSGQYSHKRIQLASSVSEFVNNIQFSYYKKDIDNNVIELLNLGGQNRALSPENDDTPPDLTVRGTPRRIRPKASSDEIAADPRLKDNKSTVKIGTRIDPDLRERFVAAAAELGITQTSALTEALEAYLDSIEMDVN